MGTIEHHTKPPGVDSADGKVSKTAWGEVHDFTLAPADITGLDAALTGKAAAAHSHAGEDITSGTVADARVAAAIARDTEVTAAVSAHEAAGDPHPGYLTPAEGNAAYDASGAATAVAGAAAAADAAHEADTTAIHGIADTSALYRVGGTDVAVADGGTGASTAANARTNLGLVIATDVEAHDPDLTTIAGLAPSNDDVLQRKAGAWANRSIAQLLVDLAAPGTTFQPLDADLTAIAALATTAYGRALLALADAAALRVAGGLVIGTDVRAQGTGDPTRASLGLDTTDSPQFAGLNVGAATDTTITRTGAGDVAVEGNALYRAGGTDVPVADGGTGASTAGGARTNLGLVIGTDVPAQATFDDHSARHESAGADAIKLDDLAAPDDNTDLDASTSKHGLLKKLPNTTTTFLRGDGAFAVPAGAELDYVEFTAPVSPTATTEATANTVVTGSAVAYDGSTIIVVEFFAPQTQPPGTAGAQMLFTLYDGASSIGQWGVVRTPSATAATGAPIRLARRLTPSNASHTYSVRAYVTTGTGTIGAGAGGSGNLMPGAIRITKAQ